MIKILLGYENVYRYLKAEQFKLFLHEEYANSSNTNILVYG